MADILPGVPDSVPGSKIGVFIGAFFVSLVLSRIIAFYLSELGIKAVGGSTVAGVPLPSIRRKAA